MTKKENDETDKYLDMVLARMPQITFSCACGLCTGAAARHFGNQVLIAGGALYAMLQVLSYMGYVDVKWNKMDTDFKQLVGRDPKELKTNLRKLTDFLTRNMPSSAAFLAGVVLAMR